VAGAVERCGEVRHRLALGGREVSDDGMTGDGGGGPGTDGWTPVTTGRATRLFASPHRPVEATPVGPDRMRANEMLP
jgi:hypothetical protein